MDWMAKQSETLFWRLKKASLSLLKILPRRPETQTVDVGLATAGPATAGPVTPHQEGLKGQAHMRANLTVEHNPDDPTPDASTSDDAPEFDAQHGTHSADEVTTRSRASPLQQHLEGEVTEPPTGVEIEVPAGQLGLDGHRPEVEATDITRVRGPAPGDRIRLSKPGAVPRFRVVQQVAASQEDLQRLLDVLNGFYGEDASDKSNRDNAQEIPTPAMVTQCDPARPICLPARPAIMAAASGANTIVR